jgi:UDP-N-acetylmuramate--alanine ligase
MNLSELKKVYISGIGGIGVSAVAKFLLSKGIEVIGSDVEKSEMTDDLEKKGVTVYYTQVGENVTFGFDLLIYSAAVPIENEERQKAKELNIPQKSYFEILGELSRDFNTIAVSGTNGKSTTTAMISGILLEAQKDPTVIVGSQYEKLDANFHAGTSDLLLVEACEYRAHMLLLQPKCIVLTNVEEDHLDFYKDLNHIKQTFQQYINLLRNKDDLLILNNDDVNVREMQMPNCKLVKYGLIHGADVLATKIRKEPGKQIFEVVYYGQSLGDFELIIPGDFNIYNALAAIAYSLSLDIPVGVIRETLKTYKGVWRRFEIVKNDNITVVSDYAHHPTAVQATIKGTKEFFPGRRLVAIFQPHQHDRTKKLFDEFTNSFDMADLVVLPEIYDVAGREEQNTEVSSKDLALSMMEQDPVKDVHATQTLDAAVEKVNPMLREEDVVLVMGAGDVYKICEKLRIQDNT